ncbi:DUF2218 domain-containing protein [Brevundimonas sp. SORGH_AS_0993]|uniref:DUF2218 domain-containing protein n=1 Tax=Brevundimonas sp. SORGH_AS_0993 TaxID=3041794 RepID=UPI00278AA4D2|nr:DUF2218 domain-containing protein [Brevundimonas sp. SORGH_AS_0993]MDQ1152814.1 hypothetical protein [Brevundimonas sp. SORGH_AS_0993]
MPETLARVPTQNAARYLQQLCKHWAHRFEVDFTPDHAVVALPEARLTLNAFPEALEILLQGESPEGVLRMRDVVQSHVDSFAFREAPLEFTWRP